MDAVKYLKDRTRMTKTGKNNLHDTLFNSVGNKENMKVRIKTRVYIPEYKSDGAAGMDIRALLPRGSCIVFPQSMG